MKIFLIKTKIFKRNSNEISTDLVYPIFLLSNIETQVLGKIWNLINLTIPGKLFEHELYMGLALIGLYQVFV